MKHLAAIDPYNIVLTANSLPEAVRRLLEVNDYNVEGPLKRFGAEIDLVALHKADPFASAIYIEVTTEYVNNEKYGKDCTKFVAILQQDAKARCLIVSSTGFTADVVERARAARIETLTYAALLKMFERFEPYLNSLLQSEDQAKELEMLDSSYEEPFFDDSVGHDLAIDYLQKWRDLPAGSKRWLVVVGEYGTGKTALTKVLLYRWSKAYLADPRLPIVFRIELRSFTRQFDANGLIHNFLDHNGLSHISIDYVFRLIRSGRLILLLDGYDEMAQYMTARERRACLEALAHLAQDGARGILTSRPNYFTEAEELNLFESLYRELETQVAIARSAGELVERERRVDDLLRSYVIERFERSLRDLTPAQTESLVKRRLVGDVAGQEMILSLLARIFRDEGALGAKRRLSGKPVIIAYLLEVIDALVADNEVHPAQLTEWSVYKLIVDKLMFRDYQRSPIIAPSERRQALQGLALALSSKDAAFIDEEDFRKFVAKDWRGRPGMSGDERRKEIDARFDDIRSSTTLTRSSDERGKSHFNFSHNSLREFLVAEHCLGALQAKGPATELAPTVTDAMRMFAASQNAEDVARQTHALAARFQEDARSSGIWLTLLWEALQRHFVVNGDSNGETTASILKMICGADRLGGGVTLSRLVMSSQEAPQALRRFDFSETELMSVDLTAADLSEASFMRSWIDGSAFVSTKLEAANFDQAVLSDVDFSNADVNGASFLSVDLDSTIIIVTDSGKERLAGQKMLGYLRSRGAVVGDIEPYWAHFFDRRFWIAEKICRKLCEQRSRQLLGLTQKGAAAEDPVFARKLVEALERSGFVQRVEGRRQLVELTADGRDELLKFINKEGYLPDCVREELER